MKSARLVDAKVSVFFDSIKDRSAEIEARYLSLTPNSARLTKEATHHLPGGFTRDAYLRRPYPPYFKEGKGGCITDVDGRELVDLWFNATSLPLGHCDPRVVDAVKVQLEKGTAFYGPTALERQVAAELAQRLPSMERVRFTSSGSEAVMMALRIARAFTGRDIVVKFEGCYHGSYDDVCWSVAPSGDMIGPADRPVPVPASAGLLAPSGRVLVLPFNDLEATARHIKESADTIAAVIVEPLSNRIGLNIADRDFLVGLKKLCAQYGIVLVFDEVISCRVDYSGTQGIVGVRPHLTTLGKIIGGGFPVGAVGGRAEIMAVSETHHPLRVSHTGTFNANPITLVAGKATLEALTPEVCQQLNAKGEHLRTRLGAVTKSFPIQISGAGSLFKINATPHEITDYRAVLTIDNIWQELVSLELINEGFLLSNTLGGCVSTATTDGHIEAFVSSFQKIITAN